RTRCVLARCVELEQLRRHLLDGFFGLSSRVLPRTSADLVQLRRRLVACIAARYPALDQVEPVDRHAQDLAVRILDGERLDLLPADAHLLEAAEASDAVVEMHDEVARVQLCE